MKRKITIGKMNILISVGNAYSLSKVGSLAGAQHLGWNIISGDQATSTALHCEGIEFISLERYFNLSLLRDDENLHNFSHPQVLRHITVDDENPEEVSLLINNPINVVIANFAHDEEFNVDPLDCSRYQVLSTALRVPSVITFHECPDNTCGITNLFEETKLAFWKRVEIRRQSTEYMERYHSNFQHFLMPLAMRARPMVERQDLEEVQRRWSGKLVVR